jgi:hypothetical protein
MEAGSMTDATAPPAAEVERAARAGWADDD